MPFFCLHAMYSMNGESEMRQLDKKFMNLYSFLERCLTPTYLNLLAFSGALADETRVSGASPLTACL